MRRTVRLFMLLLLLIVLPLQVAAQDATPPAGTEASPAAESADLLAALGYPTLSFTATDAETLELPEGEIAAGRYHITFTNESDLMADLEFFMLPEGATMEDLAAAFEAIEVFFTEGSGELPDLLFELVSNGGAITTPGGTGHVVLDLTPGTWVTNLYAYDETTPATNVPYEIEVTGEMPELSDPEGVTTVSLFEMDFAVEGDLSSGPQLLRLANTGEMPHHLILSSVPEGTTENDVIALAMAFGGPPASPEAATPEPALSFEDVQDVYGSLPLSAGQHNIIQLDLAPGTYAMICFLPDMDGVPHVVQGMVEVVVVE